MYDVIEKATDASINPVPKNDKIEPRMRNIESMLSSKLFDSFLRYIRINAT
jgi:hypothetical protein